MSFDGIWIDEPTWTKLPMDAMPPARKGRQDSKWLPFLPQLTVDTVIVIWCLDKKRMNQIRSNIQGSFRQARKTKHGMEFNLRTRGLQEGVYWNLYVWKELPIPKAAGDFTLEDYERVKSIHTT